MDFTVFTSHFPWNFRFYGEGLNGLLQARSKDLRGIVNGVDYEDFNPETDKYIEHNYNAVNFRKEKVKNKTALQAELGLEVDPKKMMIGSRRYWPILCPGTSMQSGGTYSHTAPRPFREPQAESHPGTAHPSHRQSDQSPSDPSDGKPRRSSSSWDTPRPCPTRYTAPATPSWCPLSLSRVA